jgi:hypothetical protein
MSEVAIHNAPNPNDMEKFYALLNEYAYSLAEVCRFMVVIGPNKFLGNTQLGAKIRGDLSFLCTETELPGKSLNLSEARYYGPKFKYPTQTEYEDITLTFLVRDFMYERMFFDEWMYLINPMDQYDFMYRNDYSTNIDIIQYSSVVEEEEKHGATYKMTLREAYPIQVNSMPLNWGEDAFHKVQVSFTYTDWVTDVDEKPEKFNLVGSFTDEARSVFGASK